MVGNPLKLRWELWEISGIQMCFQQQLPAVLPAQWWQWVVLIPALRPSRKLGPCMAMQWEGDEISGVQLHTPKMDGFFWDVSYHKDWKLLIWYWYVFQHADNSSHWYVVGSVIWKITFEAQTDPSSESYFGREPFSKSRWAFSFR